MRHEPTPIRRSLLRTPSRPACAAVGLHLLLVLVLVYHPPVRTAHEQMPGTQRGTRLTLYYQPGGAPPAAARPAAQPVARLTAPALPTPAAQPPRPVKATAQPSARPSPAPGTDSFGAGDISMALLEHYPDPNPDLSALPPGTVGDVVLDIIIDPAGNVTGIELKQGLGHGIDQAVIDTVRHWTYHPATRDGLAIASGQQLHFHYERA